MDQNSNVNLQVVQGDFPIKYGPKTHGQYLKKPYLGNFKIQCEIPFVLLFFIIDQNALKKNCSIIRYTF